MTTTRSLKAFSLGAVMLAAALAVPAGAEEAASKVVRLFAVRTETDSGLIDHLLADFEAQTGYQVKIATGKDVYEQARAGKADIMLSHYRHGGIGAFVTEGYGLWPEPVMANITAYLAPPGDPAKVRGLENGVEIFRRIAAAKAPFIVNGDPNSRYLMDTLWNAAGRPDKQGWYKDTGEEGLDSTKRASAEHAYTAWGVTAFIEAKKTNELALDLVVPTDSLMQRIMVTVIGNPAKLPQVNLAGAKALQKFLLSPAVQGRIDAFRYAGIDEPVFLAAGRNNEDPVVQEVTEPGFAKAP